MPCGGWNMVLLRHDVPDGTWHFDWMLDLGGGSGGMASEGGLMTFRVWDRPDAAPVGGAIRAEPLTNHRREYLTYEGEISGGRGRVTRVLTGRARRVSDGPEGVEFEASFEGGATGWWRAPRAGANAAVIELTRFR